MLKMVDGTGIIGVDMVCPLGGTVSPPQPPNYDKVEVEGVGSLMLPNSLKAPLERVELLGNSVQGENPAPDNPQEIKSVGRKSKNLFDAKKAKSGWITSDGKQTLATLGSIDNVISDYIQVYPGMNYTSSASVYQNFYDSEKNFLNHNPNANTSIVVPDNAKYMIVVVGVDRALAIQTANTLMINIGSSALPYEQYTDKYLLDVKVTGKNLLSNKSADWQIGKKTSWSANPEYPIDANVPDISNALFFMNVKPSTKYTFVNKENDKLWVNRIIECEGKKGVQNHALYQNESLNYNKYTFITKDRTTSIIFQIKKIDNTELLSSDIESIKIMLVEGEADENTPYEPYTEQSMQIVLNEPLRGIGDYKDMLTKDGVVRKIKRVVLDGSEDEEWRLDRKLENHINFALVIKGAITVNTGIRTMMDKFKYLRAVWNNDLPGQDMFGAKLRINMPKTLATDLKTFKTWLSQNPLTVDYVLAEPATEPLPESVQQQLQALHSENGTTHVFVDSGEVPCGIKLTYRKEI